MVNILFLGTGTSNAGELNPSSLAISNGNEIICIDFGGGAYHRIAKFKDPAFNYRRISTVFLTHYHVDHISGLPDLLWGETWDYSGVREERLKIIGPPGLKNFYEYRLLPFIGDYPLPFEVELVEISDGEKYSGSFFEMLSCHLNHGDYSTGYQFLFNNISLAITGDTGMCDSLLHLMEGSDIAIIEWAIPDDNENPRHLKADDIIFLLRNTNAPKKIFFTHLYLPGGVLFSEQVEHNRNLLKEFHNEYFFPVDGEKFELG